MKQLLNNTPLWAMASLTLGLAPFFPEPHLVGKLRWIWGGAVGMSLVDWGDLLFHGAPLVLLARALFVNHVLTNKKTEV